MSRQGKTVSDIALAPLPPELESRIATVEQVAMADPGMTFRDWLALGATTIAIPSLLIWLGWSG